MKPRSVHLVGAGVVGQAIMQAHVSAGIGVTIADQDPASLVDAVDRLKLPDDRWRRSKLHQSADWLPSISLRPVGESDSECSSSDAPVILIESISERLDVKRSFFARAESYFGETAILCTNTSTLRIGAIAEDLQYRERVGGMHFFMPVDQRPAVEVVRGNATSADTVDQAVDHVRRLKKEPLVVNDGPGFVVNRLLSPYLNEAMLLLGRGVSAERIERAARAYGMPLSPLELIDWIGARTMFEAGRVFWQSFPDRFDPSPILPGMIKAKQFGRATGAGFYDYCDNIRSKRLSQVAVQLSEKYQRNAVDLSDDDVVYLLAIPMWIEAAIALKQGVATDPEEFNLAMRGGLGFQAERSWLGFFDSLGSRRIIDAINRLSSLTACLQPPSALMVMLDQHSPSEAFRLFAETPPDS